MFYAKVSIDEHWDKYISTETIRRGDKGQTQMQSGLTRSNVARRLYRMRIGTLYSN